VASRSRAGAPEAAQPKHRPDGTAVVGAAEVRARAGWSKLDPFKDEIDRLLSKDAKLTGQRVRKLIEPLGLRLLATSPRPGRGSLRRSASRATSVWMPSRTSDSIALLFLAGRP
jgi:hypothetical protein